MEIASVNTSAPKPLPNNKPDNPNFKAGGALVANIMQSIENKGYFASFIIQDGIGMTIPRTITGYNRDRKVTGKINKKEGKEVFLREGLTGPYMMAVAPAVLFLSTKFCRSTNTNSNLIKRYGKTLKEFVKKEAFNNIKNDSKEFKNAYARLNIEKMYKDSVPNDKNAQNTIDSIMQEFEKLSSCNKKERNEIINKINDIINSKITETSTELFNLNNITFDKKKFNTKTAIKALDDFCTDAITKNSKASAIDETAAENIKNNFVTKRIFTNILNIVLTLAGLSVIPKLYASSDVAPCAETIVHNNPNSDTTSDVEQTDNPTFKGKGGINKNGLFARIGKFFTKYIPEKFNELMEYDGYNFTKTTFAALSIFGMIIPRIKRANDRAQIDINGKKDRTEVNEILLRDTIASLTVIFAVPIITKIFVHSYEKKSGFILTNNASAHKTPFKRFLDVINPYSKLNVLSIADLQALYTNIDSKSKLINFANFVDKNDGDLYKILSQSENHSEIFNEKTFTLESIKNLSTKEKNSKIISFFENLKVKDDNAIDESISKLMKGSKDIKNNKIFQFAKNKNSIPAFIATFIISPILLGILIPTLTYHNTRQTHKRNAQIALTEQNK